MNEELLLPPDDLVDSHVDEEIMSCLNLSSPHSFFMFAGAGSGKTRSLVNTLRSLRDNVGQKMLLQNQHIAVVTYTNAACDVIQRRIDYHPLFVISTIHSFMWELIKTYTNDLRQWLIAGVTERIYDKESKQSRPGTKTYDNRIKEIEVLKQRLDKLPTIKRFIYNPNGENTEMNSLSHTDVIKISAYLINEKSLLKKILVDKYPVFLIDESQDTKAELIDALMAVQATHKDKFSLGLLGDTMQRIYLDGKDKINIPADWEKPCKVMNHRSQKRIVDLINAIRKDVDGQEQRARRDKSGGIVRIFIADHKSEKFKIENDIRHQMARVSNDNLWDENSECRCLTIEHHMAAKRLGFDNFFIPLYSVSSYKNGLLDGTLSGVSFFLNNILPLYEAYRRSNKFDIARIVREKSIIFRNKTKLSDIQLEDVKKAKQYADQVYALWDNHEPTCIEILKCDAVQNLFELPEILRLVVLSCPGEDLENKEDQNVNIWMRSLQTPFSQVVKYNDYIKGRASFDTHQGVKGLEFPRVMVIIDDEEAQGRIFNYNKLFGVVPKSDTDIKNEQEGKDTTIERTKRLLYVTCSRAMDSLAIVFYSNSVDVTYECVSKSGWFSNDEIVKL
ncbi:MAG: UvrD-helicase domain-containing protein [Ruminiclostridium sp.]